MLVAHRFLKAAPRPILLGDDGHCEAPPFLALEALLDAGFGTGEALAILGAQRHADDAASRQFQARWQPVGAAEELGALHRSEHGDSRRHAGC